MAADEDDYDPPVEEGVTLETEKEPEEAPYVEFDITVSPADPTLELLSNQVKSGDIFVPKYQRMFVWKIEQASRLIESFLMGLPVPQVFLYVNDEDRLEIIDGQQRILSVKYFFEGYYGEADTNGKRTVFKLKGLSNRSEYNNKTFEELSPRDQRRLRNSTLRAINIKQITPKGGNDSVYHIFHRLNTGGTRLKPQEIRNAAYRGNIVSELRALNNNANWRAILGLKKSEKSQKDVEIVLRLFALFNSWNEYEKPMLSYLNTNMDENRKFDSKKALDFKIAFPTVVNEICATLNKPFRPKGVINTAALEAVMVSMLEDLSIKSKRLKNGYDMLISDPAFLRTITGGTTDTQVLRSRIRIAKETFANAEE